jgi:uncharacterized glyoxalase superfamily protein PhnB
LLFALTISTQRNHLPKEIDMNPPPKGWPRISSALFYDDGARAIDFLCRAFGFEVVVKIEGEDGRIEHSELAFGEGLIMVGQTGGKAEDGRDRSHCMSPRAVRGGNTQALCVVVDDVEAHCARARAAGASISVAPATSDYGAEYPVFRSYEAVDPEGHHWWFMQGMREATKPRAG